MSTVRTGPLSGFRVVEFATVLMGPYAGQVLAGLGADVVKVEDNAGDPGRVIGGGGRPQLAGVALNLYANKRSIALDLKADDGREAMLRLIQTADVLITNLRPGPLARLRLGYEEARAVNPRLVYCQAAGFRTDGPDADRPAFDDIIQATTGLPSLVAAMGLGMHFLPATVADKVAGLAIVNATLAALLYRSASGEGQRVEVPMFDTVLGFNLVEHLAQAAFPGGQAGYTRVLTSHRGPHRTSDGWIAMTPYTDRHWRALYEAVGCADKLGSYWHATHADRLLHADRAYAELAEIIATRTTAEWLTMCEELDIPASLAPTLDEIVNDEKGHRGVLAEAEHPVAGSYRRVRQPAVFSASPASDHRPAPLVGQDGPELLGEIGYGPDEIQALIDAGVLCGDMPRPAAGLDQSQDQRK
jgi:crotonobetainyl-CoA:carnitine CoA-transferase CaiB-like acyl-CoA transferase